MFKHVKSVSGLQAAGCTSWFTAVGLQLLVFKQQVSTWFAAVCFRFGSGECVCGVCARACVLCAGAV